jgi:hypothetical protein
MLNSGDHQIDGNNQVCQSDEKIHICGEPEDEQQRGIDGKDEEDRRDGGTEESEYSHQPRFIHNLIMLTHTATIPQGSFDWYMSAGRS